MNTNRNLAKFFAIVVRAAVAVVRRPAATDEERQNALESLDRVADELETRAAMPEGGI